MTICSLNNVLPTVLYCTVLTKLVTVYIYNIVYTVHSVQ